MTNPFAEPSSATGIVFKDYLGALLMFEVHGIEHAINTVHGPSDAVRVDIAVLDGDEAGEVFADTLVFPKVLQSQLKNNVGRKVLGRLGQGVAKAGQSAPWTLTPATPEEIKVGMKWLETNTFTNPEPVAAGKDALGDDQPPF